MTTLSPNASTAQAAPLCWICNRNQANSGEHRTKRSDLLAVLGTPTQKTPFYFHGQTRKNRPIGSLKADILKSPARICTDCNSARTQPHDQAWEHMSDWLRTRQLKAGDWVRANAIFPYDTRREMKNVHLYFLKLFGCMLCEAEANGHKAIIDVASFSKAIMSDCAHPEVYLEFGKGRGTVGSSNLHCNITEQGSVWAGWYYELDNIQVGVFYLQANRWMNRPDWWHPNSPTSSKWFQERCIQRERLG